MPERREVVVGGIYRHVDGIRYRVDRTILDATSYERTGRVKEAVEYTQLDDGIYPAGTQWTRFEKDFLRRIRHEGRLVPIFELIQENSS